MRGKFFAIILLTASIMLLSACVQRIESSADELRMYRWEAKSDNDSLVNLYFEDVNARLEIKNLDHTLTIGGLCAADENRMIICDEESGIHYTFGYQLYGDRVELSSNGSTLTLNKAE